MQIIEHYRQEIRDGQLRDGDMLPSGREIAAEFGVSLATAAKVATGLQALGLVTPRPGAGTMVTAPRPPADRARGGPIVITLASRGPPAPGKARGPGSRAGPGAQHVAAQLGIEPARPGRSAGARPSGTAPRPPCSLPGSRPRWPSLSGSAADSRLRSRSPATGPPGARTGCRPARRPLRRRGSSGSSGARRCWWCTAAGSPPTDTVIEYAELIARADTRIEYRYEYGGG